MKRFIRVGDFKLGKIEKKAINEVLDSGRLSEGKKTAEFEKKWAEFVGTKYSVAVSSGTGALICVLTALKYLHGFEKGGKVLTTPLTYIADSSAIVNCGFEPVFVDVDARTFVIKPEMIEEHLRKAKNRDRYKLILAVDLMGYPVEMDKINKIAKKYNLLVIEDAAQAHGSVYKGKKCGSQALASIYSFYIAHNIQAGEMGAVNSGNLSIIKMVKKVKAQGRICDCLVCTRVKGFCPGIIRLEGKKGDFDPRFTHDVIGYNFKTMEFQAALALTQLAKAGEIIRKRRRNVRYLNKKLRKYKDILQLPLYSDDVSYLAYPIVIKKTKIIGRKRLRKKLEEKGVETRPLFGSIPTQQPAFLYLKDKYKGKLENADFVGENGFYIGCHQYLKKEDLEYIVSVFEKILG